MEGIGLFLYEPSGDGKKEYVIRKLQEEFQKCEVETLQLDLSREDLFQRLADADRQLCSVPFDKKHFVFSMDADGFGLTLTMDGLWVDNVRYNIFSYLTKHPYYYKKALSGINSWYIALLNADQRGVSYIEEKYPHLDGAEWMLFPAFAGEYSELPWGERRYDILFFSDCSDAGKGLLKEWSMHGYSVLVCGKDWEEGGRSDRGNISFAAVTEQSFVKRLSYMGESRLTVFFHLEESERVDTEVISAMANGSFVITEKLEGFMEGFRNGEEFLLYDFGDTHELLRNSLEVLQDRALLSEKAKAGKKRAEELGSIAGFVKKILERCK